MSLISSGHQPRVPKLSFSRAQPSKVIMQATAAINGDESFEKDEKPAKFKPVYAYVVMSIILMIRVATQWQQKESRWAHLANGGGCLAKVSRNVEEASARVGGQPDMLRAAVVNQAGPAGDGDEAGVGRRHGQRDGAIVRARP